MSSSSWAIGEALQEISSQKASLEEALRQLTLIDESFESQANQAIEDVEEAVAQQISGLKQREEQLLLQIKAPWARKRQQLQLKEDQLKDAIDILSSAIQKIKQVAITDDQVGSVNQKGLQWGLGGLFDAVKETVNSVDDMAQQDLHCHLDESKLQEAISLFGQVDIAGSHEAEHAIHETISPMQSSIDTILTSCSAVSGLPVNIDGFQQWLADTEMATIVNGLTAVEAVLQGLKKQSETCELLSTVWLVDQPAQSEMTPSLDMSMYLNDDNVQQWLYAGAVDDGASPAEMVILGFEKIYVSEMSFWLHSNHEPGTSNWHGQNSFAECLQLALKQMDKEAGEWGHWLQSTSPEASSSKSPPVTIDLSLWLVPEGSGDTNSSDERITGVGIGAAFKGIAEVEETGTVTSHLDDCPQLQSTSAAESVMAALQTHFAGPLTDWMNTRDDMVPSSKWLIQENSPAMSSSQTAAEAVSSALKENFGQSHYSIWLRNSHGCDNTGSNDDNSMLFPQPDEYQLGYTSTNNNHVAAAFKTLSMKVPDYNTWLTPTCPVEAPVTPIRATQLSDNSHWLLSYQDLPLVSDHPSSAPFLDPNKPMELSHQSHNNSGKMQTLHIASHPSRMTEIEDGHLVSEAMTKALKRQDEETADIWQWLATPTAPYADQGLRMVNDLEDDSTEEGISQRLLLGEQNYSIKKPFLFQSQHLPSDDYLRSWFYHTPTGCGHSGHQASTHDEDIKFWLSAETDHPDDNDNDNGDIDAESTTTSQDFEVIDHFMKSGHLSLDDDWLYQPEQ